MHDPYAPFPNPPYLCRFDSELTQALEGADTEREQREKAIQENIALSAEILSLQRHLKVSRMSTGNKVVISEARTTGNHATVLPCSQGAQTEASALKRQEEELCAQIRDLTASPNLSSDSIPGLKKQLRQLEVQEKEHGEEISKLTADIQRHEQVTSCILTL